MLPLGFGWSLWIHLFVQYPKTVAALMFVVGLSSVSPEHPDVLQQSRAFGETVLCVLMPDTTPGVCSGD